MPKELEKHLKKVHGSEDPKHIQEIICDTCKITEIKQEDKKYLEKFINADILSLNNCGLTTLNNLPTLQLIEVVELKENKIEGKDLPKLLIYPHLSSLNLAGNLIKSLDELKPLTTLSELNFIDLSQCPVTSVEKYREKVFEILPQLMVLDMVYQTGEPYESEEGEEDNDEENGEDEDEDDDNEDDDEEEEVEDEEEEAPESTNKKKRLA